MNVEVFRKPKTNVVPMYNMKHGQIGVVVGTLYTDTVVKAIVSCSTVHVFSVDDSNIYWNSGSPGKGGGVDVALIEQGSKVTITVPQDRE